MDSRGLDNVPVLGRGDNVYQFVHADDLAEACILAAARPGATIYHCGAASFGTMRITMCSARGEVVRRLLAGSIPAGIHRAVWDGRANGGAPLPAGGNREQVTARVVDAFRRCAEHGKKYGVIEAVQNHADFIEASDQVLDIIRRVESEWFGLHLDIGSYRVNAVYDEVARTAPHAVNWQIKENVWFGRKEVKTDLKRLFGIIRQSGYRGYLPIEILSSRGGTAPKDPFKVVPEFPLHLWWKVRSISVNHLWK